MNGSEVIGEPVASDWIEKQFIQVCCKFFFFHMEKCSFLCSVALWLNIYKHQLGNVSAMCIIQSFIYLFFSIIFNSQNFGRRWRHFWPNIDPVLLNRMFKFKTPGPVAFVELDNICETNRPNLFRRSVVQDLNLPTKFRNVFFLTH